MRKATKAICNTTKEILFLVLHLLFFSVSLNAQEIITLYSSKIPNSKPSTLKEIGVGMYKDVTIPTLEYFKPNAEKASGTSVIIIPGGDIP